MKKDLAEIIACVDEEAEIFMQRVRSPEMMEAVNKRELKEINLLHAHAWHSNVPVNLFIYPEQRT